MIKTKQTYRNTLIYYLVPAIACVPGTIGAIFYIKAMVEHKLSSIAHFVGLGIVVVLILISIYRIGYFITALYLRNRCEIKISTTIEQAERYPSKINSGTPGTGKSANMLEEGAILSITLFSKQEWEYVYYSTFKDSILAKGDVADIIKMKNVVESHEFWKRNSQYAPYIVSNVKLEIMGKPVFQITRDYYEQKKRLPICIALADEVGLTLGLDLSTNKILSISELFRLCRQWGITCLSAEQYERNIYNDVRKVSVTMQYIEQTHILNAKSLKWYIDRRKRRECKLWGARDNSRSLKTTKKIVDLYKTIGYRRFTVKFLGDVEHGNGGDRTLSRFYLPSMLLGTYDDKMFLSDYKAIFKPIYLKPFGRSNTRAEEFDDVDRYNELKLTQVTEYFNSYEEVMQGVRPFDVINVDAGKEEPQPIEVVAYKTMITGQTTIYDLSAVV